ncbi:velvet factor-domain-containing protein [Phycomyces blakesleeanus]
MRQEPQRAKMSVINERDRRPIEPPPILQLNWLNCSTEETKKYLQSPFYFMVANLMKANDTTKALDSHEYLSGSTVSSLYRLRDVDNTDGGFFVFGDLAVKKDGYYRLQFNLFEIMDGTVQNRKTMLSEVFVVHLPKKFPGAIEATFLSRTFSDQGVKMRIRKEHRLQTRKRKAERQIDSDMADVKRVVVTDQEPISGQRTSCQNEVLFGRWQSNVGVTSRSLGQTGPIETIHQASSMSAVNPFNPGGEGRLRYKDLTSRFRYYPKQHENKGFYEPMDTSNSISTSTSTSTNTSISLSNSLSSSTIGTPNSPSGDIGGNTNDGEPLAQDTSEFPSPISRTHSVTSEAPEQLSWSPASNDMMKIERLASHGCGSPSSGGAWHLTNNSSSNSNSNSDSYQDTPDLFHNSSNSPPSPTPTAYTVQSPPTLIHQAPSSEAHLASYHFTASDRRPTQSYASEDTHPLSHIHYAATKNEHWGERLPPLRAIMEDQHTDQHSLHTHVAPLELPAIITSGNPHRLGADSSSSSFLPTLFPSYVPQSNQQPKKQHQHQYQHNHTHNHNHHNHQSRQTPHSMSGQDVGGIFAQCSI